MSLGASMYLAQETKNCNVVIIEDKFGGGYIKSIVAVHKDVVCTLSPVLKRLMQYGNNSFLSSAATIQIRVPPNHSDATLFLFRYMYSTSFFLEELQRSFEKDNAATSRENLQEILQQCIRICKLFEITDPYILEPILSICKNEKKEIQELIAPSQDVVVKKKTQQRRKEMNILFRGRSLRSTRKRLRCGKLMDLF